MLPIPRFRRRDAGNECGADQRSAIRQWSSAIRDLQSAQNKSVFILKNDGPRLAQARIRYLAVSAARNGDHASTAVVGRFAANRGKGTKGGRRPVSWLRLSLAACIALGSTSAAFPFAEDVAPPRNQSVRLAHEAVGCGSRGGLQRIAVMLFEQGEEDKCCKRGGVRAVACIHTGGMRLS